MGYAAKVMRGLIIDYARSRQALKRGGAFEITTLDDRARAPPSRTTRSSTRIGAAVDELAAVDPPLAEVVDLKFFGGFSFAEIARDARRLRSGPSSASGRRPASFSTARCEQSLPD